MLSSVAKISAFHCDGANFSLNSFATQINNGLHAPLRLDEINDLNDFEIEECCRGVHVSELESSTRIDFRK